MLKRTIKFGKKKKASSAGYIKNETTEVVP